MTATTQDIIATLHTLADEGDLHTVGRYIQLAWDEGLLVTGCIGTADGMVLQPGRDDDCLEDIPAQLVPYTITEGESYEQPEGTHPDGPRYVPMLVIADADGNAQAMVWAEADAPPAGANALVGVSEAGAILGWDRRKVSVYHGRGLLPAPVAELRAGPVWRLADILHYHVGQMLGVTIADLSKPDVRGSVCRTYGLDSEQPIGAQLLAQGLLSMGAAQWLDREVK